ncbi:hypothetical protein DFH06DRAFT_1336625 [Mycena polygramma]|nr:hypothetical protein DFH06DRAFT_1340330 [Mycena polygramma]KAJ7635609.1 hypothetical protein DFH06DRAFT_1336625 [Mycena polygramma]
MAARSAFRDAVRYVRERKNIVPDACMYFIQQDGELTSDENEAYQTYLQSESQNSVVCCALTIDSVNSYLADLQVVALI